MRAARPTISSICRIVERASLTRRWRATLSQWERASCEKQVAISAIYAIHFGPGKGVASPVLSWFAFVAAQVLIDCEPLVPWRKPGGSGSGGFVVSVCDCRWTSVTMRPFMPFSNYNPFLGLVGDGTLYDACVVAGIVGLIHALRSLRAQRDVPVR